MNKRRLLSTVQVKVENELHPCATNYLYDGEIFFDGKNEVQSIHPIAVV
jgi:hypothetical protein